MSVDATMTHRSLVSSRIQVLHIPARSQPPNQVAVPLPRVI
jgi:hypothetical protein